ncbi:MAG TPA: hypothetical protein VM532_05975, partial [Burkholderiales bacterium]|nr:hypothetical protein [Burkholderiales bacterium]
MSNFDDSANPIPEHQAAVSDDETSRDIKNLRNRINGLQEQWKELLECYKREFPDEESAPLTRRDLLFEKQDTDCRALKKIGDDLVKARGELLGASAQDSEKARLEKINQAKALLTERDDLYLARVNISKERVSLVDKEKEVEDALDALEQEFKTLQEGGDAEAVEKRRAMMIKVRALAKQESVAFDFYGFDAGLKVMQAVVGRGVTIRAWELKPLLADAPEDQTSLLEGILNDAQLNNGSEERDPLTELENQRLARKAELNKPGADSEGESLINSLESVLARPDGPSSHDAEASLNAVSPSSFLLMEESPFALKRRLTWLGLDLLWIDIERIRKEEPLQEAELNRLQGEYEE